MEFYIRNFFVLDIAGVEVWITETAVVTWIIMLILISLAIVVRIRLKKFTDKPSGLQNVIETAVEMFDKFVANTAGVQLSFLGNWFFMVFAFIMLSNFSGAFGLRPPTADWSMTFALAVATFILIQAMGIKFRKGSYLKDFLKPFPIFLPLNIIGELARPVSLSFRLFGNILAGMILLSVVYTLAPIGARFVLPAALHGYFDIIIGLIQTYIFCALSLAFVANAAGIEPE